MFRVKKQSSYTAWKGLELALCFSVWECLDNKIKWPGLIFWYYLYILDCLSIYLNVLSFILSLDVLPSVHPWSLSHAFTILSSSFNPPYLHSVLFFIMSLSFPVFSFLGSFSHLRRTCLPLLSFLPFFLLSIPFFLTHLLFSFLFHPCNLPSLEVWKAEPWNRSSYCLLCCSVTLQAAVFSCAAVKMTDVCRCKINSFLGFYISVLSWNRCNCIYIYFFLCS